MPNPSATDWVGLYQVGAPDMAYQSWVYVSGSVSPGTPAASGSAAFTVPTTSTPGSYEVRYFISNSYTRLATSDSVAVTSPTPTTTPEATATATIGTSTPVATSTAVPTATGVPSTDPTPTQISTSSGDWRSIVVPEPEGDRKANHGWFVSWVAQIAKTFEDVKHGLIVSFFAQSDLGTDDDKEKKANHSNRGNDDATATAAAAASTPTTAPTSTAQPTATAVPATATATTVPPTATAVPATATTIPTEPPTATATTTPTQNAARDAKKEDKKNPRGQQDEEDEDKKNPGGHRDEENSGQTSGSALSNVDGSETAPTATPSAGRSEDSRGPKEGRKVGTTGDAGSPPVADEEEVNPGNNERESSEVDRDRDQRETTPRNDPKPNSGGRNR